MCVGQPKSEDQKSENSPVASATSKNRTMLMHKAIMPFQNTELESVEQAEFKPVIDAKL